MIKVHWAIRVDTDPDIMFKQLHGMATTLRNHPKADYYVLKKLATEPFSCDVFVIYESEFYVSEIELRAALKDYAENH